MSASHKGSVDPTQNRIIRAVSDRLIVAEIATDEGDEEIARRLLNFASTGIRQLERIYKHR